MRSVGGSLTCDVGWRHGACSTSPFTPPFTPSFTLHSLVDVGTLNKSKRAATSYECTGTPARLKRAVLHAGKPYPDIYIEAARRIKVPAHLG